MLFTDYQNRIQSIVDKLQNNAEETRLLALAQKANHNNGDFLVLMKNHKDLTTQLSALIDRVENEGLEDEP
jgi:hypothetical protein